MLLLRGTRAMQILSGLAVLLLPTLVYSFFPLNTIVWIVEKILPIGLLALLVLFQPEVRRALERIGRGSFLRAGFLGEEQVHKLIKEVREAVAEMKKRKIGALIVIARTTRLEDYYDPSRRGVMLRAEIRAELLHSIFVPTTPLHDGAVIIENGRVEAAGCLLPLTEKPDLDKALGSRHRAGIGITDVSDAVAVIVSEETGTISIAVGGGINRGLDPEGVERNLKRYLGSQGRIFRGGRAS